MEWKLDEARKEFVSPCGKYKITNEGRHGGSLYAVWTLADWSSHGKGYRDFVRLVRVGTLEHCKRYEP
jgi:hypothetical protein